MEFYIYCIDNKYVLRLGYDRIDVGGGKVILIGDKAAPYGVVAKIIFVWEEGGAGVDIWWYLYNVIFLEYEYLYGLYYNRIVLRRRSLCRYSWTNISICRRKGYIMWWFTIII